VQLAPLLINQTTFSVELQIIVELSTVVYGLHLQLLQLVLLIHVMFVEEIIQIKIVLEFALDSVLPMDTVDAASLEIKIVPAFVMEQAFMMALVYVVLAV